MTARFTDHILAGGLLADRPVATAVPAGALYPATDTNIIYRSDGAAWSTWRGAAPGGVQSVVAGTNVTVDNTDPANPVISASGGGGSTALLDPATPDDDFTGSALPAGWSTSGSYVAGDYTVHDSFIDVATGRAAGSYFYRAAPAGDFVATMKVDAFTTAAAMFGIIAADNTGAGVGMGWYNSNPDAPLSGTLAGGAWDAGSTNSAAGPKGTFAGGGMTTWYRLRKVGTSYYGAISINGNTWSAETVKTSTATMTRVGFGAWYGTVAKFQVYYFDVA